MRFGLQASRMATLDDVRAAVGTGFEALFLPDHLMGTPLAVGPTLATAATLNPRLTVGAMVYANDFRHPLLLAREAATLQALTQGRFVCGLGTGWDEREYRAAGLSLDPPGVRVARLEEALEVLEGAWSGREFSFSGEFYRIDGFLGAPVARPRLMLGGGGRKLLRLAARKADIVNLNARLGAALDIYTFDRLEEQLGWLADSPVERTLTVFYGRVGPDTGDDLERYALQRGFTVDEARRSPLYLFGTEEEVRERLALLESYGIRRVILSQWGCDLPSFRSVL